MSKVTKEAIECYGQLENINLNIDEDDCLVISLTPGQVKIFPSGKLISFIPHDDVSLQVSSFSSAEKAAEKYKEWRN